jgi:eukaryotic-like serine/threonine-protein kinase
MNSLKYGRYEIIKYLGGGTMGDVFVAHDPQFDSRVALKVLKKERVEDEEIRQRFLNEPKITRRVAHPNIVTVYDVGFDHGTMFIAMELLEGKSLDKIIKENRLTPKQIIGIGIQIATALHYTHQKRIFHRDIKPANIIRSSDGQFKLTDFGIARIQDLKQTTYGTVMGSPYYMSPEQATAQPVDGRSDIYSLGAVLYECATGKPPFQADNFRDLRPKIINDPPAPLLKNGKPLPPGLSSVILKSLEKNPGKRYQTGNEMNASLTKCLSEISAGTNWIQKLKKVAIIFGIIILVSGIALILRHFLQPRTTLKINSTPPGAQVFIGDEFKGRTPFDIKLPLGEFDFRFSLHDYYTWEATVKLDGEDETLDINLEPMEEKSSNIPSKHGEEIK